MTPPTTQPMISPSLCISQPTETSVSSRYIKIIGDMVGKFVPGNQMSEVFSQLAERFKEEEGRDATVLSGSQISKIPMEEPKAQPPNASPSSQSRVPLCDTAGTDENFEQRSNVKGEVEGAQRPVNEKSDKKMREVLDVDELESGDEKSTLSERRRNFRAQRGLEREELRNMREEAAVLAAAKREAAERRRKGKSVATPNESKKSNPTSLGVVNREAETNSA